MRGRITVECGAEPRVLDLIAKVGERDEVERITQGRADHRRADVDHDVRLAVAIGTDADPALARIGIARHDRPTQLLRKAPGPPVSLPPQTVFPSPPVPFS